MLIVDNVPTQDEYVESLTLQSPFGGRLVYVVANQSARVQFKPLPDDPHAAIADWQPPEGVLLTPQSSFIDKIAGARFKTAVAGSPARIIAQLSEPGDILPASGTPFSGQLGATGAVASLELSYTEPGNTLVGIAAEAAPTTVLQFPSLTFDGATRIKVEVFCPDYVVGGGVGNLTGVSLWDMAIPVDVGRMILYQPANAAQTRIPLYMARLFTPGVGTFSFAARMWAAAAGNAFGASTAWPVWGRITTA